MVEGLCQLKIGSSVSINEDRGLDLNTHAEKCCLCLQLSVEPRLAENPKEEGFQKATLIRGNLKQQRANHWIHKEARHKLRNQQEFGYSNDHPGHNVKTSI